MNYKNKYLKYKDKYLELKKILEGSANPLSGDMCILQNIFDLDCILPLTKNINEDYIFNKKISKETINYIRNEIQQYYKYFCNYLIYPKLSYEDIQKDSFRHEIYIPIIEEYKIINNHDRHLGKVNYNLMAQKIKNIKLIEKAQQLYNMDMEKNNILLDIKKFVLSIEDNDVKKSINNMNLDNVNNLSDLDNIINILELKEKQKKDEYNLKVDEYNSKRDEYNSKRDEYNSKRDEYTKKIELYKLKVNEFNEFVKLHKDITEINRDIDKINKDMNKLKEDKSKINEDMDKLKEDKNKINEDMDKLKKDMNKINDYIESYNNKKKKIYDIIRNKNELNNKIISSETHLLKNLINYNNTNDVMSMMEDKKKEICKNILNNFNKNPHLNIQILYIVLQFYDSNVNNLGISKKYSNGHANYVTIYRFKKDGKDAYLCLRTEPHRHTTLYCRNSVRKATRDIFKYLDNSYYLDFIIDSKKGLQGREDDESKDIEKENITDYDNLPYNIKNLSPLQGNSGFCASWSLYSVMIMILNQNKSLNEIGKYFASFNIQSNFIPKTQQLKEEYDKCHNTMEQIKDSSCRSRQIFEDEFKKYINYKKTNTIREYKLMYEDYDKKNNKYILIKHIKLYRMLIFISYFLIRKLKIIKFFDNITNQNDKNILDEIFNKFDNINIMNIITQQIINAQNNFINITQDILDRDTHKCDDNLFEHNEFCQLDDIIKSIPNGDKYNCVNSKLKKDNNIILKGVENTIKDTTIEQEKYYKLSTENIKYLMDKLKL